MAKAIAFAAFLLLFAHGHAMADFVQGRDAFLSGRYQKAYQIFHSAAQTGDTKSQIGLGLLLTWGKGTAKNILEAYQWFDRVATCAEPVHPVVRILARTNRDYLAKTMSLAALADAETVAALRLMQDTGEPDNETPAATVVTIATVPPARYEVTLQPNFTALAGVE